MDEPKDDKFLSLVTMLLVCGCSSLLFTAGMKWLNGEILQFFLRSGIICLGTGGLLLILYAFYRYQTSEKDTERYGR